MKFKVIISVFCAALFSLSAFYTHAQAIPQATIGTVLKKAQTIELTIQSTEAFYVGNNIFLLHIGNSMFHKYKQTDEEGKGKLTYLIPASDYAKLIDGEKLYLTYGVLFAPNKSDQDLQNVCRDNPNAAKYLGDFSTKMLKK